MKLKSLLFSTLAFFMLTNHSFSKQIDIELTNMVYTSGGGINNCGLINFQSNPSVTIELRVNMYKEPNHFISSAELLPVARFNSSASLNGLTSQGITVTSSDWTGDTYSEIITITLDAEDFDLFDGSFYMGFNGDLSCAHPVEKNDPASFSIYPSSVIIDCNSTDPVTFIVENENASSSTLEYQWQIGNGWEYEGNSVSNLTTPFNTIVLTPTQYPPGDVRVTPVIGGESFPLLTSSVSLSEFNPDYEITGDNAFCDSGSYSLDNLIGGTIVSSWVSSNESIATISANGNAATLTAIGNGIVKISAIVTNSCGQEAIISKNNIAVGKPKVLNHQIKGGHDNVSINSSSQLNVDYVPGTTSYYWFITTVHSNCGSGGTGPKFNAYGTLSPTLSSTTKYASINWGNCTGTFVINCRAVNSCGTSDISHKVVDVFGYNNDPCPDGPWELKSYPNPSKNGSITVNKLPPGNPCNEISEFKTSQKISNAVRIVDLFGNTVYQNTFTTNTFDINTLKLKRGNYILNVSSADGQNLRETIVIE